MQLILNFRKMFKVIIFGLKYTVKKKSDVILLNLITGTEKLAVWTRCQDREQWTQWYRVHFVLAF